MWPERGDLGKEYNIAAPRALGNESPLITLNSALKEVAQMVREAKGDPSELSSILKASSVGVLPAMKDIKALSGFKELQTALNGKNAFDLSDGMISIMPGQNFSESTINGQKVIPPKGPSLSAGLNR